MPFRPSDPTLLATRSRRRQVATLVGAACLLGALPAGAAVLQVPAEHSTITAALAAASPNDEIQVAPGIYSPSTNGESFPLFLTTDGVRLIGAGFESTVLDAETVSRVVHVDAAGDVRVSGFTITGGIHTRGAGVFVATGAPEIDHNFVLGNGASVRGAGILAIGTATPWIHHNVVWESFDTIPADEVDPHGVLHQDNAAGITEHNLIGRTDGNGLLTSDLAQPVVRHNIFLENGQPDPVRGRGICWLSDSPAIITHNLFHANVIAALLWPAGGGNVSGTTANDVDPLDDVYGNLDGDPLLADPDNEDFHLTPGSLAIDAGDPTLPFDPDGTIADLGPFYLDQTLVGVAVTSPARELRAFPNPFRARTRIAFDGRASRVEVFDPSGRRVRTLSGRDGTAEWDGRDASGRPVAAGVYLVRVRTDRSVHSVPVVRLR